MRKKSLILSLVFVMAAVIWTSGCRDDVKGPGTDGMENSGARISVNFKQADLMIDVYDPLGIPDATWDFTMESLGPIADEDPLTDVYVEGYNIEYRSNDPDAVPLQSVWVALGVWLEPGKQFSFKDMLLMPTDIINDYYVNAPNPTREAVYECYMTFTGYNAYGYKTSSVYQLGITLADYAG